MKMQSQQVTANAQVAAAAAASAQSPQIVGTAGVVNTNAVILKMNDIQTTSTVGEYLLYLKKQNFYAAISFHCGHPLIDYHLRSIFVSHEVSYKIYMYYQYYGQTSKPYDLYRIRK